MEEDECESRVRREVGSLEEFPENTLDGGDEIYSTLALESEVHRGTFLRSKLAIVGVI